ncbi:hypothetical protein ABLT32_02130 [Bacteroides pyogenes]|uniref:hypothetical protein n=1 Tax=Bacteroides pyogenes TaxID=310300 RepID=UPI004062B858
MSKNKIEFSIIDDKIRVVTPYNSRFIDKARNFRGEWKDGAWWFDDSIIDYVRDTMMEIFGTTGDTEYKECDLLVENYSDSQLCAPVVLFGRVIAQASGRGSGAKLGSSIIFLSGEYRSGGSLKNWQTVVSNATFIIKDFPEHSLSADAEVKKAIEDGWCKVQHREKKRRIEDIMSDIEKCREALSNLEKELEDAKRP